MITILFREPAREFSVYLHGLLEGEFGTGSVIQGAASFLSGATDADTEISNGIKGQKAILVVLDQFWEGDWLLDEQDYDILALKAAKQHNVKVYVLPINGQSMPAKEQVADSASKLFDAERITIRLDPADFPFDYQILLDALKKQGFARTSPSRVSNIQAPMNQVNNTTQQSGGLYPSSSGSKYNKPAYKESRRSGGGSGCIVAIIAIVGAILAGGYYISENPLIEPTVAPVAFNYDFSFATSTNTPRPRPTSTPEPRLLDTLYVSSNGDYVTTDFYSQTGTTYLITVEGTFAYDDSQYGDLYADAEYRIGDNIELERHSMFRIGLDNLQPSYSDTENSYYEYRVQGDGLRIGFDIDDNWYLDNSGGLTVQVWEMP